MSTDIGKTSHADTKRTSVTVTSFSGGPTGQCLQLTQRQQFVSMSEEQVREAVHMMTEWLEDRPAPSLHPHQIKALQSIEDLTGMSLHLPMDS